MTTKKKNVPVSSDYQYFVNNEVFSQIPPNVTCLDVGCWKGGLGMALIKQKQCIVDGIDVQSDVLKIAKKNGYRNTYKINLNNDDYSLKGINNKYDIIICADILEHLIDPEFFLVQLKSKLKKEGKVVISLPNIAFGLNRLLLLFGKWDYTKYGTLDMTHLRFFTITSLQQMIRSAGYTIIKVKPYNQFGLLRYLRPFDTIFPGLLAYQLLLVATL